jgi:tetratricopeptide (TPR) repeat protein
MQQQGDLSVSYSKLGNALVAKGNLDDALKAYRDSLAIAQRLAASDRNNTQRQRNLILSYEKVSDVLITQGRLYDALKVRRDSLAIDERLATADRSNVGAESGQSASYVVADTLQGQMPQIRAFSLSR